jgi:hypothetical protein
VANPHILRLNALVILPTDILLLLIMFFGLIRLRFHKSSAIGMGRLLWRQVGYRCFSLTVVFSFR